MATTGCTSVITWALAAKMIAPACRSDARLDDVVDMVDGRDLIGQHFNDQQDAHHDQDPRVGQDVIRRIEMDQLAVMGNDNLLPATGYRRSVPRSLKVQKQP